MEQVLKATKYCPTAARTGGGMDLFRMKNSFIRGQLSDGDPYIEAYGGSENLSETIATSALTGTIAIASTSKVVTGTGTAFKTELHLGQRVLLNSTGVSYLLVVDSITDDTHFVATKTQTATLSGKTGYRLPRLFELNKKRGTMSWGNAVEFDKGTILAVGDGTLRVNGAVLQGSSLVLTTRRPKLAIFDSATGNYSIYALGMTTPAAPTVASVAGGTKAMQAGNYGLVIAPSRTATLGFNNGTIPVVTALTATQKFEVTPAAFDTTHGQDAWDVYGTLYNLGNVPPYNGPWFLVRQITAADITAGKFTVEWLDAELTGTAVLLTFDNDAPVDAEFVAVLSGVPVYVSCQGPGSTSPGPVIISAKIGNPEAAPLENAIPLSPPQTIIGVTSGLGRLYLQTPGSLQIAQSIPDAPYILTRPFWKTGFKNPDSLIFVNGTLYGLPNAGPTRSIADGDEGAEETAFAADVEELTSAWIPGQGLVAHDPKNNAVCFFHAADSLNASGFWTTRVLVYGLKQNAWIGDVTLESTTTDMIVCGAVAVDGRLEYLAGGRKADNSVEIGTYRFDTGGAGNSVSGYVAWAFSDSGEQKRDKLIANPIVTGKFTSANLMVYGASATESVPVTSLEAGTGSLTGAISITDASTVTISRQLPLKVRAAVWTARIDFSSPDTGTRDRIDKVVFDVEMIGARR
jgi:hypothetical protein